MRERPILFSGEMVRAILKGRKTQTRRIVKVQPENVVQDSFGRFGTDNGYSFTGYIECPYGRPGDRLWVRETWADVTRAFQSYDCEDIQNVAFRADGSVYVAGGAYLEKLGDSGIFVKKWKPSIFLPRYASRITLEITSIRVERLQAISEADAMAEGVPVGQRATVPGGKHANCVNCGQHRNQHVGQVRGCFGGTGDIFSTNTYRGGFAFLWDQINGKRASWTSNPWVWVIEFKRAEVTA